ncbi:MAG: phosphohistidine phosphatase SixA [Schleiferiaceae bacterium]
MKTIYLVRHAKSSWELENIDDYDRPLKGRGIRDAHLVSQYVSEESGKIQAIYSSPATRALHTAIIFSRTLGIPLSKISLQEELYLSTVREMLTFIGTLDSKLDTIMVFTHNPTITQFINEMTDVNIHNVPTSGVGCLRFDSPTWDLNKGSGELLYFDYPKKRKNKA